MNDDNGNTLGEIIRQQRISISLTLRELTVMSGVSVSYLSRIEGGERFPSARILRKIAKPLGFGENKLFTLAGYLSPQPSSIAEGNQGYNTGQVDSSVVRVVPGARPENKKVSY